MVLKKIRALLKRGSRPNRNQTSDDPDPPARPATEPSPAPPAATRPVTIHRGPEVVHHPVALQDLDADAVRIVKRLARFEHTAYLVGGCVRDLLLDRKPKDFDIGTSATPRQIKRLFSNCRIIGRRFRLAHIYFQSGKIIEVATFRARDGGGDVESADGAAVEGATEAATDDLLIRDDNIFGTPEEDALRRDFTINALFYDVNAETVIDHADGLGDLRRRLVRTIGDPAVRFREDPIRILRAIKFAARLDFAIEPKTLAALRETRGEIPKAAPPRVLEEFNRFCRGGAGTQSFLLCFETGVFDVILPELAATYGSDGPERRALATLLTAIDERWKAGHDVATGEIFAALIFAAVAPRLGISLDGSEPPRDRRDARTIVDDVLRPIALRLRVSRRDQEHARQALIVLHRLVATRPMRRAARQALTRRPSYRDALAILDALAAAFGGSIATARTAWHGGHADDHAGSPETTLDRVHAGDGSGAEPTEPPARRRRRGRRGGRGRRRDREGQPLSAEGAPVAPPSSADRPAAAPSRPQRAPAAPARTAKMPPVWDDNYFFAALPSVPKGHTESHEHDTDRYGAGAVVNAPSSRSEAPSGETEAADRGDPSPKPRRRRRGGRGRRRAGPIIPPGGEDPASPPSEEGGDEP